MTTRSFAPASGAVTSVGSLLPQCSLTNADRVRPRVRIRSRVLGVPVYAVRSTSGNKQGGDARYARRPA